MEEMLSGAQEGALKAMQLTQSQETLKFNDRAFIQASAVSNGFKRVYSSK